ncbi:hypothetical protein MKW94_015220 [Papaver nudicaule]|uniref:RNA polymerase II C-terminal domain phosphatase-like n=1 Tax=Papaver nudicaule TaxID=74823 RepID=A0AA41S791_PAPNU|nr:hypothetical protein [Papaver nudicaule]
MATSVISPLQQILYPQQKRKINYGFEDDKRIKTSCNQQQKRKITEEQSQKAKRIKTTTYTPTPPVSPPLLMSNTKELSDDYNRAQNKRLRLLSLKCGNTIRKSYFVEKKLCLVLDLDHTLLHSVRVQDVISADERDYLNEMVSSPTEDSYGDNLYITTVNGGERYTKLRPHTREFLKKASGMFQLFIYTMGTRAYARKMGKLLDPENVFFKKNINVVSREDSTSETTKNLDVLAGPNERNTVIIDDTRCVWPNNNRNLIEINKYKYFTDEKLGYQLNKDVDEEDESLKSILEVLEDVHKTFFDFHPVPQSGSAELEEFAKSVDVRPVLGAFTSNEV